MMILYPGAFCFLIFMAWYIYNYIKKNSEKLNFEKFLILTSVSVMFFLSPIMTTLAEFLNCKSINNVDYIAVNLIEKCSENSRYTFWRNILIIPTFMLFGIILPLLTFHYMYKNRFQLFDRKIIYKIGFLLNGYSPSTFYWFILKLFLNFIY